MKRVAMEWEVLLVADDVGTPLHREAATDILNTLCSRYGYRPFRDLVTSALTAVSAPYGDISFEASVSTLEVSFCPFANLFELEAAFCSALRDLKSVVAPNVRFLTLSRQPVMLDDADSYERYVSPKGVYSVIRRRGWNHRANLTTASTQPCVDVDFASAMEATSVMQALTGVFVGLFANSPLAYGEVTGSMESRALTWPDFMRTSHVPEDLTRMIGIPQTPSWDWAHYLYRVWDHVPVFLPEKGGREKKALCLVPDGDFTFLQFLESEESKPFLLFDGDFGIHVSFSPDWFFVDKGFWWAFWTTRIRGEFDSSIQVPALARAVRRGDTIIVDSMVSKHLSKAYLEVRDIGTTRESLTGVALVLGLIENLREAHALVELLSWDEWRNLHIRAIMSGFDAVRAFVPEFLRIATHGLRSRGLGEEIFLYPLLERTESPASVVLRQFEVGGITEVIRHNTY